LLLFFLGLLAEGLQIWVPWRSFSLMDLLSNLAGIGAGWGITVILLRKGYDGVTVRRYDGTTV
jgi:VanZ family protein